MGNLSRVLITGATGFIGSNLTRRLVKEGFDVGIIKREKSDVRMLGDFNNKIDAYAVDLQDAQGVSKVVSHFKPEFIFHLAAYHAVEHKLQDTSLMVDTNVLGTINMLEASKDSMVKLFVNTSSCSVYKERKDNLTESSDLSPLSLYALTKIQAEQACSFYAENYDLKTISFRLFHTYGPADNERRLVPYVVKELLKGKRPKLTKGTQEWDFTYVCDIADAYIRTLSISDFPQKHEVFNVGTGNATSVREVASLIREIIDCKVEPEFGAIPHRKREIWHFCADISKIRSFLGWKPETKLRNGLEQTVDWYQKRLINSGELD